MSQRSVLRLVAINDVYELTNLPKVQTFLTKLSTTLPPSAVILAGDFLSPSTLTTIDGGRGVVATLRGMGLTHAVLGNHEQDLKLSTLQDRLSELGRSVSIINSNIYGNWLKSITQPYSIIHDRDNTIRAALLGFMTDEPGVFRDNTFKGLPIQNVIDSYQQQYEQQLQMSSHLNSMADICIPITHQSKTRDMDLAEKMLEQIMSGVTDNNKNVPSHQHGLIIGGHDHEPMHEIVTNGNTQQSIHIIKSGMNAQAASLIDLEFEMVPINDNNVENNDNGTTIHKPILSNINYDLVDMTTFDASVIVQQIVTQQLSIIDELQVEKVVDKHTIIMSALEPGVILSSVGTKSQQTTVGGILCQMIKEELEVDAAIINGGTIKGDCDYPTNEMTYADVKKELPFPTKMVTVPMRRYELTQAIHESRTSPSDTSQRRGYLQVDLDFHQSGEHFGDQSDVLHVALPRNLLNGFCNIPTLMDIGQQLKDTNQFPGDEDFAPAIDIVVRYACKHRWVQILESLTSFRELDLNQDGVLDRNEVKQLIQEYIGHEPSEFLINDMINSIDTDENGVIDLGEFSYLLATMEREQRW